MSRRIAIVGTRPPSIRTWNAMVPPRHPNATAMVEKERASQQRVFELIRSDVVRFMLALPEGVTIVSGGANGVDALAASLARQRRFTLVEHLPRPEEHGGRFGPAAYARNQLIVDDAEDLYAWPSPWGRGTWDTIARARRKGKLREVFEPWVRVK
ncbi:MAG: hypothetical protein HOW73_43375 [Polyangiaceae bacterium]|nr:hypothetical protein [Polyangiaceae bacterium]